MNILFLVKDLNSGTGECIKSVARFALKKGHNVRILTQYSYESSKNEFDIQVISKNLIEKLQSRINNSFILKSLITLHRIKVLLYYPIWPINSLFRPLKYVYIAKKAIENNNIDVFVCAYNPIDSLIAGHIIKYFKGDSILYVPYFLDAFYGGQKPKFMSESTKKRKALKWEQILLNNADGIVMMDPAENSYKIDNICPAYLKKTIFLDLPLFIPAKISSHRRIFPQNQLVFFFAGAMPKNIRNPKYLLDLFQQLNIENVHLYLAGTSDYMDLLKRAIKNCKRIHFLGRLDHIRVSEMMNEADVLINIGNSLSYMVPSKIFEYMSRNIPIISTYRIENDPCARYLKIYKKALLLDERCNICISIEFVKKFICSLSAVTSGLESPIEENFHKNKPEAFCDYLEKLFFKKLEK